MKYWKSGKQLQNGKYIIQDLLGIGGFGITYRALEQNSNQLVAIKTLNYRVQRKPNFDKYQENFLNEALCLAKCSHPNVVEVHRLFKENKLWCMVMEYIDGDDLGIYREEQDGIISESEAIHLIKQVGEALKFIHNQGFLHRDVKPQNILLRRDTLEAILIDFGLAREFNSGSVQTHTTDSTLYFAPIEQYEIRAKRGAFTDIYALAATLYVLLTGEMPTPAKVRQEGKIPLIPPKKYNSQISDRVNNAIIQGMKLEPEERPQFVVEWLTLLSPVKEFIITNIPSTVPATLPIITDTPPELLTVDSSLELELETFKFEYLKIKISPNCEIIETQKEQRETQQFIENIANKIFLEMVSIPGNTFLMGSPKTTAEKWETESPQHTVTIPPLFVSKYPITQGQWQAVMGKNQAYFKGENRPVEMVSWYNAIEFCRQLSAQTGKTYRLLSEAEWEYVCRGETTTLFYFGNSLITDLANYNGEEAYACSLQQNYREQTTDVGSFPPNAFGLYDLHGNVWEWCADPWHNNYQGAPSDGSVWEKDSNYNYRMLRGGGYLNYSKGCRSANRNWKTPRSRYKSVGFRVAVSHPVSILIGKSF
ncbi:bifunctional serine/threonine-protein kinase/formylglycine-generating enzyme family protein [Okeania sp. SIO2B3]|uniref:bifunctional serine/threonine-protein kinase/formylglycine-generating enzyme family protein n=1 Tax=Okeania sp. SIO2B3 TaxID=2607784 RepID=UPI0013C12C4B|nr:bifunctional serine/threonine-protein kinase/formylglycine-generating enzyme family protein [Okeania sp. SIO2B3]NET43650.1 SUMF1/EgtB/PvdO family nonheme iron enzyme [Okeania sp. SIO2B3]